MYLHDGLLSEMNLHYFIQYIFNPIVKLYVLYFCFISLLQYIKKLYNLKSIVFFENDENIVLNSANSLSWTICKSILFQMF